MQLGYSLLLREYITAMEVDYGDCQQFQITCPACHEAIFKAGKYGQDRQYFSHYAASKSDVGVCELRVAALTREAIEAKNILGHGQSMEHFFSQFRNYVVRWLYPDTAVEMQRQLNWMAARPTFIRFSVMIGKIITLTLKGDGEDEFLSMVSGEFEPVHSKYWIARQLGFARDFLNHLLAPNSTSALAFLLALSTDVAMLPAIGASLSVAAEAKHTLLYGRDRHVAKMLQKLQNEGRFEGFAALLVRTLHLTLMLIPYISFLADDPKDESNRDLLFSLNDFETVSNLLDQTMRGYSDKLYAKHITDFKS